MLQINEMEAHKICGGKRCVVCGEPCDKLYEISGIFAYKHDSCEPTDETWEVLKEGALAFH